MGSITDFLEQELLDHVFNAAYTPASTVYLCLCTSDPTDAATGASMNECADANNYAREAVTFNAASSRAITNQLVTFNQASGSWGTATHWAVATSGTHGSGDCLAHGAFESGKAIVSGNTPSVAADEIDVTFSANDVSNYLANLFLDFAFRNQAFSAPDTYVAACTATISDSDTGSSITEPAGGSYARKQVDVNGGTPPTWDVATGTTPALVDNTHEIAMATATASWGTIVAVAICDAATVGNLLFYDNDMSDQAVGNGDTMKFPIGDLDATLS